MYTNVHRQNYIHSHIPMYMYSGQYLYTFTSLYTLSTDTHKQIHFLSIKPELMYTRSVTCLKAL